MKINKAKMMVSTLAIIAGAATVGSISGTVAWFQYNTRVTAAYVGTTASTTGALQIKVGNNAYKADLTSTDISTYLTSVSNNTTVKPITFGAQASGDALPATAYGNPVYQYFDYSSWQLAAATDYISLPLTVKYTSVEETPAALSDQDVWIKDLRIQAHTGSEDISSAIRVHMATASQKFLFSKEAAEVDAGAKLDLNNDSQEDIQVTSGAHYDFDGAGTPGTYGSNGKITSVAPSSVYPTDNKGALSGGTPLGKTNSDGELAITVTIWLEGWAKLDDKVLWDVKYQGVQFDVGMQFATSTR